MNIYLEFIRWGLQWKLKREQSFRTKLRRTALVTLLEVDLSAQVYLILSDLNDPGRPEDPRRLEEPGRTEDQVWNWNFCDLLFYSLLVRFW